MSRGRKAGIIAGIIICFIAIGVFVLQTGPAKRYIFGKVQALLAQTSGIHLRASNMNYTLGRRVFVTMDNVVVRSTQAPELPPVAQIEQVELQLALLPLLHGKTVIADGTTRNPHLHVVMTAAGKNNIPSSPPGQQQSSSNSSFHIDNLKITGGSLRVEHQAQHFTLELPEWNARIKGAAGDAEQLVLNTKAAGQAGYQGRTIAVRGISLDGVLGTNSADIHKFDLALEDSQFKLAGAVNDFSHPVLDLRADADVHLGALAQFAGLKQRVEGGVLIQATATGPVSAPVADLTLRGRNLHIEDFRDLAIGADAHYQGDTHRLRLSNLDLGSSAGGLHASGELALTTAAGQSEIQAQLHSLNLEQVTRLLGSKLKIASIATGDVRATWSGMEYRRADGRAALHLTSLRGRPAKNILPLAGDVVAIARNGQIRLTIGAQQPGAAQLGELRNWQAFLNLHDTSRRAEHPGGRVTPEGPVLRMPPRERPVRVVPAAYKVPQGSSPAATMTVAIGGNPSIAASLLLAFFQAAQAPVSNMQALQTLATLLHGQITIGADKRLSGTLKAHITDMREFLTRLNELQGGQGPLVGSTVEGAADITAVLGGTIDAPRLKVQASAPALRVGQLQGVAVQVTALYQPTLLTIRQANLRWRDESAVITGTVGLKGKNPPVKLDAQVSGVQLEAVMTGMDRPNAKANGSLSLNAHVRGTIKALVANLSVHGTGLALYGEPLGTLDLEAVLQNNLLRVTRLQMLKPGARRLLPGAQFLTATGTYNLKTKAYSLDARANNFNLQHLALPSGKTIAGNFNFTAQGSGTLDNPGVNARLNVTGLQVDQNKLGTVAAVVNVANQLAHIRVQAPEFNLATVASVGIRAPYPAQFNLTAANLNLGTLPIQVPGGLSGVFSGHAEGTLELQHPEAARVTAEIQSLNVNYRGQDVRALQPIVARYNDRVLNLQPTTIVAGASRIQIGGQIPLEAGLAPANMQIAGNFDLASVRQFVPSLAEADARGQLRLDLGLRGSLRALQPLGTISLRNGFFKSGGMPAPVRAANFDAQIGNGVVTLRDLSARFASATLRANGSVPLALLPAKLPIAAPPTAVPARFAADFTGLDLASIPSMPSDVKGLVSVHLEAQAPRPQLSALSALLRFDQLRLSVAAMPVEQQGTSAVVVQNGVARVQQFRLAGPQTGLELAGTADLAPPHALNLTLRGNTNAGLASVFFTDVKLTGRTQIEVALSGTAQAPHAQGFVSVQNGSAAMQEPDIALSRLNLRVDMNGDRVDIAQLTGSLNGGTLTGGGGFNFGKGGLSNVGLHVTAKDAALDYPEGLRTVSDATLTLTSQRDLYVLGGDVTIQEGSFRRYVNLQTEVLSYLHGGGPELTPVQQPGSFQEKLRFDLPVKTKTPLLIENNVAKAAVSADLKLQGSYYVPSVTGRAQLLEAGELYLNGKTFYIQRGVVDFVNAARIEPLLDLSAQTQTAGYTITMNVNGPAGKLTTQLVSDPPLAQPDIIAVLVFGQPLQDVRNSELNVAAQQAFFYIAGGLGGALSNQIQSATGISEVRVDPSLVAGEATPGARFTIGQKLTKALKIVYSMDLIDPSDRIWIGQYAITRRFLTQVTKQSDNSYRLDLRHDQAFGGSPLFQSGGLPTRKVQAINITGNTGIYDPGKIAHKLDLERGKNYDFFKANKGIDKIQHDYQKHGYLESRARLSTQPYDSKIDVNLHVAAGPSVQFAFEGWKVPRHVRSDIRKVWAEGVFDVQRALDSANLIRTELIKQGYLDAQVKYYVTRPGRGQKNVSFDIIPGPRYRDVRVVFQGARHIEGEDLREVLKSAHVQDQLLTEPSRVRRVLQTAYEDQGYITAKVRDPFLRRNPQMGTGEIVIPIDEGPLYHVADVGFTGNHAFPAERLKTAAGIDSKDVYKPEMRNPALIKVQNLYWDDGYLDMLVTFAAYPDPKSATVKLVFNIAEGKQSVVHRIVVDGTDQTSPKLVRSDVDLKPGDVASNNRIAISRANLYSTGAYDLVDITTQPLADPPGTDQQPVELKVHVHEVRPWRWLYGGYYDTDRGPGVISEVTNSNTLGDARVLGLLTRYDKNFQEGRLYFSQPFLRKFPYISTGAAYFVRNSHAAFVDDHVGFSVEQERKFRHKWVLNYSYRLERTRIFNLTSSVIAPGNTSAAPNASPTANVPGAGLLPAPTGGGSQGRCPPGSTPTNNPNVPGGCASVFTTPIPPHGSLSTRIAPMSGTVSRDTRDDVLDATHGQLFSQGLAAGFGFVGSQQHYLKYLGQYYTFMALGKPKPSPWKSNIKRPRLVYAGAVRLGFAGGLGGQPLIASERFFAGGGTTVRGFKQDELGPKDPNGIPIGGNAEFIINNEMRFPVFWIFDGAGFIDLGNVYPLASDFRPWDLRKTAGGGVRVHTPYFLLRADYGIKLDRKPGESFGAFFFSIGQAF